MATTLEERIDRLERANRRIKWWGIAGFVALISVGFLALVALGLASEPFVPLNQEVVRARAVHIEDEMGIVRATLAVTPKGPSLKFFNAEGQSRTVLGLISDLPVLNLYDVEGTVRASLMVSPDGPALGFLDSEGSTRSLLSLGQSLVFYDAEGAARASLGLGPRGPGLGLSDTEGRLRALLALPGVEGGDLSLQDQVPGPALVFIDEEENTLWSAPIPAQSP